LAGLIGMMHKPFTTHAAHRQLAASAAIALIAVLPAFVSTAPAAAATCPSGYVCLYTDDSFHGYMDGFPARNLDDIQGKQYTIFKDMISSWKNTSRYDLCAYDKHWWGWQKIWTMPHLSQSVYVGDEDNDKINAIGPC
jgi:hypothetical protein